MKKMLCEPVRPYGGRDYELMRRGREGTYWEAAEGLIVRVAAAERERRVRAGRSVPARVTLATVFGVLSR